MATATQTQTLLTAEEYARQPDLDDPTELVRGRIVRMNQPRPYHGYLCNNFGLILGNHAREHELGYVMSNDSGVITERGPDTVRGADVCFYSFAKVPKGSLPRDRYLDVAPNLVVEILSPDDRWPKVLTKVAEYLNAGVEVVAVLDPGRRNLHLYEGELPVRILSEDDEFALPGLLGDLRVAVRRFLD